MLIIEDHILKPANIRAQEVICVVTQPECDRADSGALSALPPGKSEAGGLIWGRTELSVAKRWIFSWVSPQPAPWHYTSRREAAVAVQAEEPYASLQTLRALRPWARLSPAVDTHSGMVPNVEEGLGQE